MSAGSYDFTFEQGKTISRVLAWDTAPLNYKQITSISATAPATVAATAHGLVNGQRVAFESVKGPTALNASANPPRGRDYHKATVIDANTVSFADINGADLPAHVANSGYLVFLTRTALAGYTARMSIKDRFGGTELLRLDTTNGRITIDTVKNTITLSIDAITMAAQAWTSGVYDLEMVSAAGAVTALLQGRVFVTPEVTTT